MFIKPKKSVGSVLKQLQRERVALKSKVDTQNACLSQLWTFLEARFGKTTGPFDIPAMQQQILQFSKDAEYARKEQDRITQERDSLSQKLAMINRVPTDQLDIFPNGKGKARHQLQEAKKRISEMVDEMDALRKEIELLKGTSLSGREASVSPAPKAQAQRSKWDDLLKDI